MQADEEAIRRIISLMDLTSLNDDDSTDSIEAFCARSCTPFGVPAAICIYPDFVPTVHQSLSRSGIREHVRIATVVNFPEGDGSGAEASAATLRAVCLGADEVDVVFPWKALLQGDEISGHDLVSACRDACGEKLLKIIIESGELQAPDLVRTASTIAIKAGADFIKTSTGKVSINATPEAARIMLQTIADINRDCGFKAAGGVRTRKEAQVYLNIAADIFSSEWISPAHFRFGASGLLDNLLEEGKQDKVAGY